MIIPKVTHYHARRQNLSITGVLDVLAFDEEMRYWNRNGRAHHKGTELHVNKLIWRKRTGNRRWDRKLGL